MTDPAPGARVFTLAAELDADGEWLEADGLGGFASGPVLGPRTRRYHALLLSATAPPSGRVVLVNGVEAVVRCGDVSVPLATNRYLPDVLYPEGVRHVVSFSADPWPCWVFDLGGGTSLTQEIFVAPDTAETVLRWSLRDAAAPWRLEVRPLLTGRDYHALHRENAAFDFSAQVQGGNVCWRPYPGLPAVAALSNGLYRHAPEWFRDLRYDAERARGLDYVEDVASPGVFTWDLMPARVITDPRTAGTLPSPSRKGRGEGRHRFPPPLAGGVGGGAG